ncbi:MAG TPA: CBS domain-containing protein [Methylomirabilota bacterium]|jgi:predicted transcriptional regulator
MASSNSPSPTKQRQFAQVTVSDVMHKGVVTCPPDADLQTAAALMASNHVHSLVVIGISSRQKPQTLVWGALSDLDLLRAS